MREKIWEYRNKSLKKEDIIALSQSCRIPPAMAVILMNRGILTEKAVMTYMKKSLESVHNPLMMDDMEIACDRIHTALMQNEKIVIYGDYDVDGVTATSIVYKFLRSVGADVSYYIPDRFSEGYGINILAVNKLAKTGAKLMITVDCGIASVGEIEFAKTQGIDVIVTDHHTCREELPKALAVINPKRPDSVYAFDGLAGAGVAFKLVLALAIKLGMNTKDVFAEYVELAAIGTIADVVPLVDENRVIAEKGIKSIQNTKNKGIRALIGAASLEGKIIDSTSVAFFMAPRLNAAGRMDSAKVAVELMTCEDDLEAEKICQEIDILNAKRKQEEQIVQKEALEILEKEGERLVYVLCGEGWNHGVVGIVASRICEQLYRPCILVSFDGEKGKGSGRSVPGMNLFDALSDSEELLTAFGGHAQAAGLSINRSHIEEFKNKINEFAKKNINTEELVPKLKIDCNLDPASVTANSAKMLENLAPFGEGNEQPVFSMTGLKVISASAMGADGRHLRMRLSDGKCVFSAVGFGMSEYLEWVKEGDTVSVAFNMNINTYQGAENLQLILKDIKK